jgi:pleiotropic regulator 1
LLLLLLLSTHVCRWVRSIAFDPSNEWFCTGSSDRTIKLWETGTGQLKLTLTGHIEQVSMG